MVSVKNILLRKTFLYFLGAYKIKSKSQGVILKTSTMGLYIPLHIYLLLFLHIHFKFQPVLKYYCSLKPTFIFQTSQLLFVMFITDFYVDDKYVMLIQNIRKYWSLRVSINLECSWPSPSQIISPGVFLVSVDGKICPFTFSGWRSWYPLLLLSFISHTQILALPSKYI